MSFSNDPDPTFASSPSSSKAAVTRQPHTYLDVPSFRPSRPSRPSLDSAYSELSELSFHTTELQSRHPLSHGVSDIDGAPTGSVRSRIVTSLQSFYVTNYGAMLVMLAQLFGAGMNVSTRLLETTGHHGQPMHPFQILFVRQSITASLCTSYGIYSKSLPDFPFGAREVRWLLAARGICGFFGVFGMYFSLLYLPLSEATVLTFLSPILTCYLCSFVMSGETFTRQQQLAGLISLAGVIFIAQPASLLPSSSSTSSPPPNPSISQSSNSTTTPDPHQPTEEQHLTAIGVAMLGVLGTTGALTSIRAIGQRAHAFISINYFSVWCTIVSLVALILIPDVKLRLPANITEWSLLANLSLCGFATQFLLTAGLSYGGPARTHILENRRDGQSTQKIRDLESNDTSAFGGHHHQASGQDGLVIGTRRQESSSLGTPKSRHSGTRATSMVYTQMLFALAADKLVFGITPSTISWVGSILILAGAVWVASARDSATEDEPPEVDGHTREAAGSFLVVGTRRHGNSKEMAEETVGLMHDQEYDDVDGDIRRRHPDGSDYIDRQDTGHPAVESLEMHQLQSANTGS
ncbi:hypothetical protein A1O3_08295 [Capronia epimyces CBS 606.96]|uniref:EamA domain-containing protein n=1 Tax=Capronia epimyces CBS 606.96 TaxID=1182542 RepID=W9YCE7_9EURO|nr:uncharacterized protein A1O3_08295 [Capronia epimyces CBS 606.96]EXJ80009.1 hypothetical protein A1O3_08295 [Capronia epimyces CBS 606.96]